MLDGTAYFSVYEPLGKDLEILISETSKRGGFSVGVIQIVAKHILLALKTLHECEIDGVKVVHTDIKPKNIAACMSQNSFSDQLKTILKDPDNVYSLRMACETKIPKIDYLFHFYFQKLNACQLPSPMETTSKGLAFKLIDFGNVMVGLFPRKRTRGLLVSFRKKEKLAARELMAIDHLNSFSVLR